jgi:CRISPR-associated protein Cas2
MRRARWFIICYDVCQAKRLTKLYRILFAAAQPMQYSVFLFFGDDAELLQLHRKMLRVIKANIDDLRIYPLNGQSNLYWAGRTLLPTGVFDHSAPSWCGLE